MSSRNVRPSRNPNNRPKEPVTLSDGSPGSGIGHGGEAGQAALLAVTVAVLTVILLPGVVQMSPAIYFETDPRSTLGGQVAAALGPAGLAWFHGISVLIAAAAVGVHVWLGGRIRWGACALAMIGIAACAWQMPQHFDNRLFGAAWIAAVSLALAVLHLGEHAAARRWLMAGLIAMLVPFVLDAVWYAMVEHPATVAHFEANERELIESRGWQMGSAAHQSYEQRLRASDALGAFGLSNVFGSITASLTILGAAVTISLWRGRPRLWMLVAGGTTVGGLITTWLTHSRGALLALPIGLGLIALAWLMRRWRPARWAVPTVAVLLVLAAIGAVLLRGAMGPPETAEGERSLLFRYHYWQGAARLIQADWPASALQGLGPAGFEAAYLWAKNPISPEDVDSAHNVFVDYVTMLGIGGAAWSALLLLWLWQAGRVVMCKPMDDATSSSEPEVQDKLSRPGIAAIATVTTLVFGFHFLLKVNAYFGARAPGVVGDETLYQVGSVVLALIEHDGLWSAAGFALVMGVLLKRDVGDGWWSRAGLLGAAAVLLIHNQVEMGFYQFASVGMVWAVIALAASRHEPKPEPKAAPQPHAEHVRWTDRRWALGAGLGIVAVWLLIATAVPFTQQQHHLAQAATLLQRNQYDATLDELDTAARVIPHHPETLKQRVHLRLEMAVMLKQHGRRDVAARLLREASDVVAHAEAANLHGPLVPRLRASVEQTTARVSGQAQHRTRAAEALREVIQRTPHNMRYRIELADLYWEMGDHAAAAEQYRAAQRISERYYLDPMKQLTAEQREHIHERLGEVP